MHTLSKLLLLLAIAVGVPSLPSPALASGVHAAQGRKHRPRHRAHHRERQRERRHEERGHEEHHDHPGEL